MADTSKLPRTPEEELEVDGVDISDIAMHNSNAKVRLKTAVLAVHTKRRFLRGDYRIRMRWIVMTRSETVLTFPIREILVAAHDLDATFEMLEQICENSSKAQKWARSQSVDVAYIAAVKAIDLEATETSLRVMEG